MNRPLRGRGDGWRPWLFQLSFFVPKKESFGKEKNIFNMESAEFIQWCLDNLNYATVTFLMAIESSFIPFPSEIVIPPAAYRAASSGEMNLVLIIIFATIGANIGALVNYFLSRYLGRPIIYKFVESRLGHMLLLDSEKVATAEKYFDDHGAISTFIGRLIPAVRQLISIPAGLARMNVGRFALFTTLGALIWNTVLACAGYFLESVLPEDEMLEMVIHYNTEFKIICAIIIAILLGIVTFRALKSSNRKQ